MYLSEFLVEGLSGCLHNSWNSTLTFTNMML